MPGKYSYRLNTQSTCEPEISRPVPRLAPTRRSTSSHYSNLAFHVISVHQTSSGDSQGKRNPVQRPSPIIRYPSISLAAAAVAALRLLRRLIQVLRRIMIELIFAFGAAEVIRLSSVLGVSSGGSCFYLHAAYRIFHSGDAIHRNLLGSRIRFDCVSILSGSSISGRPSFLFPSSSSSRFSCACPLHPASWPCSLPWTAYGHSSFVSGQSQLAATPSGSSCWLVRSPCGSS